MSTQQYFQLQRQAELPSLGAQTSYFKHSRCGAEHFHLHMPGGENAFMVAFRTLPEDSTGVAHILEHTTLCGSAKYPVRDPFFLMMRRSLSSFMNAMTASDWTAYPFATRCEPDFWNLLEVYLDATFFPLLRPEDFAQEGHRIEFKDSKDTASELEIRGVVYNEMKGAMSAPTNLLWHGLTRHLCEGTVYEHISGGDPAVIPQLTHESLVRFHRRFYRPGNAIFMTAGELPVQQIQQRIEQLVLGKTQTELTPPAAVAAHPRWQSGRSRSDRYPTDSDNADRNHSLTAWLLPDSRDPLVRLRVQLMADLLLGTAASPLRKKLESSGLGRGLSPISGLEDSLRDSIFACGLKDVARADLPLVPKLIRDSLQDICKKGIERPQMEAAFQQLEFGCREITGDSVPFVLELLLEALPDLLYGQAPEPGLDPSGYLKQLSQETQSKDFVGTWIRANLLDNPHILTYELTADSTLAAAQQREHEDRLHKLHTDMNREDRDRLGERQQQLARHQEKPDDPNLLPGVGTEHLDGKLAMPEATCEGNISLYRAPTNGIGYLEMAFPLTDLNRTEAALLPLYCACLTGLGVGDTDYTATQTLRARFLGGLSASTHCSALPSGEPIVWLSLAAKALDRHRQPMLQMPLQLLTEWRVDEIKRIGEIRDQMLAGRENAIAGNGHRLILQAAAASFSPQAAWHHNSGGLGGLQYLAGEPSLHRPEQLAEQLAALHQKVVSGGWKAALVAGNGQMDALYQQAEADGIGSAEPSWQTTHLDLPEAGEQAGFLWQLPVSYCALAVPIPGRLHPDAPALAVLAALLRHHWLHPHVREQGGAYGAGAISNPSGGSFSFFSYRDPRLAETLEDFRRSLEALPKLLNDEALREAILAPAGAMNQTGSPAGEALTAFHRLLLGRDNSSRTAYRDRLLEVTAEDLLRVASAWLGGERQSTAVLTGTERLGVLQKLGFQSRPLELSDRA